MCPLWLLYLVAWHIGGRLYRGLYYVEFVQPLFSDFRNVYGLTDTGNFSYRHLFMLLIVNPAIVVRYAVIGSFLAGFVYSSVLMFYVFVCYCILLYLLVLVSGYAWNIVRLSTRWTILRQTCYFARCYVRDVAED